MLSFHLHFCLGYKDTNLNRSLYPERQNRPVGGNSGASLILPGHFLLPKRGKICTLPGTGGLTPRRSWNPYSFNKMFRTTLLAFLTLFLSITLIAQEPTGELEATVVQIMIQAYQVGDYDTVETLFDKISPDSKKNFLQKAVAMSEVVIGRDTNVIPGTFLDMSFLAPMLVTLNETNAKEMSESLERWATERSKQTQLLGRLTLSLFEQSARAKPQVAHQLAKPAVVQQRSGKIVRVYYVDDILNMTSEEKSEKKEDGWHFKSVIDIITKVIEPDSWKDGDVVLTMHGATKSLAIRQTEEVHAQIDDLLNQIRVASEKQAVVR